jgi:hypothetical protein
MEGILASATQTQARLWDMVVVDARKDMKSDVAALYVESLNDLFAIHATRVAVGLQGRIPEGVWLTLSILTILGMTAIGYQTGIAGSKRTFAMALLAVAFGSVIALIGSLDRPTGGYTRVSQQPLIDLLSVIASDTQHKAPVR